MVLENFCWALIPQSPYSQMDCLWHVKAQFPTAQYTRTCSTPSWWKQKHENFQIFIQLLGMLSIRCVRVIRNISMGLKKNSLYQTYEQ
jgi:hypothetical protein